MPQSEIQANLKGRDLKTKKLLECHYQGLGIFFFSLTKMLDIWVAYDIIYTPPHIRELANDAVTRRSTHLDLMEVLFTYMK